VFYVGGTKVGALCGEAIVFTHANAPKHFFSSIKQHGALLAKGRVVGVQFDTLFTDGLYFELARHAIRMADRVREILRSKGYKFYIETITNQIFVELTPDEYKKVSKNVKVGFWERTAAGNTVVRFATSWSTKEENVEALKKGICNLEKHIENIQGFGGQHGVAALRIEALVNVNFFYAQDAGIDGGNSLFGGGVIVGTLAQNGDIFHCQTALILLCVALLPLKAFRAAD
jgi:hypothetical protein